MCYYAFQQKPGGIEEISMNTVTVNGLRMAPSENRGTGKRIAYCITGRLIDMDAIKFPSLRTMRRLSREYLGCELDKHPLGNKGNFFCFYISGGTRQEKRAAFLAAVIANSSPT